MKFFETRILLQPSASIPEGPLDPFVFSAALKIVDSVMFWNIAGSTKGVGPLIRIEFSASAVLGVHELLSFFN